MSLPLAASLTALAAIFANRILAMGVGLWFGVPTGLLLGMLLGLDIVQIPMYYRIYEHGSTLLDRIPAFKKIIHRNQSESKLGKWAKPMGGIGVMLVAALPTMGGGMWTSTFLAYGLGLKRRAGYAWMIAGSLLSYLTLYWILDTLIRTIRYFMH